MCVLFWCIVGIVALVLRNFFDFKNAQIAVGNQEHLHERRSNEFSHEVEVVIRCEALFIDGQNAQEQVESIYRTPERIGAQPAQNAIIVVLLVLVVGLLDLLGLRPLSSYSL